MNTLPVTQKEYQYLPKVKKFYYLIIFGLVIVELVLIRLNYPKIRDEKWYLGVIHLLIASSLPVSILYRLIRHIHPLIHTRFSWHEKGIKLIKRGKELQVDFDQISKIKISRWPTWWGGGFNIHLKSGQVFYLLSFIEKGHEILSNLMQKRPSVEVVGPVTGYLKRAPYIAATWNRWLLMRKHWHWFVLKHLTMPLIAAIWLWQKNVDSGFPLEGWLISAFVGNAFISSGVYQMQEEWLLHKASQAKSSEAVFLKWVYGFQSLYFVVAVTTLFLVGLVQF